jgi:hypothetical protein
MKIHFKCTTGLLAQIRTDLERRHPHATERVGFALCRFGTADSELTIIAHAYSPVADDHYEVDPNVGARINGSAFRAALQRAVADSVGVFHVHSHLHTGLPQPSSIDWTEWQRFVPDFWHVRPELAHGALIVSANRMAGWCWYPSRNQPIQIRKFSVVGRGIERWEVGA